MTKVKQKVIIEKGKALVRKFFSRPWVVLGLDPFQLEAPNHLVLTTISFRIMNDKRSKGTLGAVLLRGSIHASHPAVLVLILRFPKNFCLDVAEIY